MRVGVEEEEGAGNKEVRTLDIRRMHEIKLKMIATHRGRIASGIKHVKENSKTTIGWDMGEGRVR